MYIDFFVTFLMIPAILAAVGLIGGIVFFVVFGKNKKKIFMISGILAFVITVVCILYIAGFMLVYLVGGMLFSGEGSIAPEYRSNYVNENENRNENEEPEIGGNDIIGIGMDEAMDLLVDAIWESMEHQTTVFHTGEGVVDGQKCYLFSYGDNSQEKFTAFEHYAVTGGGEIYIMDILTGEYEPLQMK